MKPLVPRSHTGRLVHHRHTSYAGLIFLILFTLAVTAAVSGAVTAGNGDTGGFGQTGVYAAVAAPRPASAPTVNVPASAVSLPVTVSGNCQSDTLVKVFKNGIFAGAAFCSGGAYSLPIGLFFGPNSITAVSYNSLDQSGPVSAAAVVVYSPPGVTVPPAFAAFSESTLPANQPVLLAEIFYKGFNVGEAASWPVRIRGGTAPYAVSISWGDGTTELLVRSSDGPVPLSHVYKAPGGAHGGYDVVIKLTDSKGLAAYLQFVAVVPGSAIPATRAGLPAGLALAWPAAVAAMLAVISFWLGELREKRLLAGAAG